MRICRLLGVQVDSSLRGLCAQAPWRRAILGQHRQAFLRPTGDDGEAGEDGVREVLLSQLFLDVFLRNEFGGVRSQTKQSIGRRHDQFLGGVRACAVERHDDKVATMSDADLSEEPAHVEGVQVASDHPVELLLLRSESVIGVVDPAVAALADYGRYQPGSPAAEDLRPAHETDIASKHRTHCVPGDLLVLGLGTHRVGELLRRAACATGLLFRCPVTDATLSLTFGARNQSTTDGAAPDSTVGPARPATARRPGIQRSADRFFQCPRKRCSYCSVTAGRRRSPPVAPLRLQTRRQACRLAQSRHVSRRRSAPDTKHGCGLHRRGSWYRRRQHGSRAAQTVQARRLWSQRFGVRHQTRGCPSRSRRVSFRSSAVLRSMPRPVKP